MKDITQASVPVKAVVAVGLWVASVVGIYYTLKSDLELEKYKMNEVMKKTDQLNEKVDRIISILGN